MKREQVTDLLIKICSDHGVACTSVTDECENSFKISVKVDEDYYSIIRLPRPWEGQRTTWYNIPKYSNVIELLSRIAKHMKESEEYDKTRPPPRLSRVAGGFMEMIGKSVKDFADIAKWEPCATGYSCQIESPINKENVFLYRYLNKIFVTDLSFEINNVHFNIVEDEHSMETILELNSGDVFSETLLSSIEGKFLHEIIGNLPKCLEGIKIKSFDIAKDLTLIIRLPLEYKDF